MRRFQMFLLMTVMTVFGSAAFAGGVKSVTVTLTSNSASGASAQIDLCTDSICSSGYPLTCVTPISVTGATSASFLCTAPSGNYKAYSYVMTDGQATCTVAADPLTWVPVCGNASFTLTIGGGTTSTGGPRKSK